jgi:tRNA threonylcarbamoyladenosine biosynthesis protein TsaE
VLIQQYRGRRPVCHIDAYRLRDEDEFDQLGPDELFESDALVLVEWADRVTGSLPRERIEIRIEVTGPRSRRFEVRAVGPRYEPVIDELRRTTG